MESQPTLVRFSLSDVPVNERATTLHEAFGRAVLNMDLKPLTEEPQFKLECQFLPGAIVTRGWNTPHALTSSYDTSRENDDFVVVWGSTAGSLSQNGKEALSERGPVLISCAESTRAMMGRTAKHTTVRLQRSLLLSVLPHAESLIMQQSAGPDNQRLRLLNGYLSLLRAERTADPDLEHAAAVHICDLVALVFGTGRDCGQIASSRGLRAARFRLIKHWVITHLSDPSLSLAAAAAAQGLSPRYVQILFAEAGPTFSEYVLSMRLRLAHRCFRNWRLRARQISSIAYDAGFNDLSYFNRSFKSAYGETPSDVRSRTWHETQTASF
jgi:AraC-like DNA-binding protein